MRLCNGPMEIRAGHVKVSIKVRNSGTFIGTDTTWVLFSEKTLIEGFSDDIKDDEHENVAPGPISDSVAPEPMNPRSTELGIVSQSNKSFLATDQIKFLSWKVEARKNPPCSIQTPTHRETPKENVARRITGDWAFQKAEKGIHWGIRDTKLNFAIVLRLWDWYRLRK